MNREYDAVVVGGGMAGLACAAYLSRYGYRTMLCEKGQKTGGLVGTFWHRGFAFDSGIRAFENSGILYPMLKSLGIDMEFSANPVSIGIGQSWTQLISRDSLSDYAAMLTAFFPSDATDIVRIAQEIRKVMAYMDVLYGIDNPLFLENMHDQQYLLKTLLPWLLRYQVNIRKANRLNEPICAYLQRFTHNQALIDMIAQHFFKETPTFFALSYFGLYLDYSYPKGGTGALAQRVTDCILSSGGEIMTDSEVNRVDASTRQIVTADGEQYRYRKLVWAADQKALYASINAPDSAAIVRQRAAAGQGTGGDSILTLYLGANLGADYFKNICGAHAFYTASTEGLSSLPAWEKAAAQGQDQLWMWLASYLERTTYEISCPALRDQSLAPDGQTGVIVSTLMDYGLVRHFSDGGHYDMFKAFCSEKILALLEANLFPGIGRETIFSLCSTPLTIERETGNSHGAITGWAFTNKAMPAENRFPKITSSIKTPVEDIYQCGQWVFSPSGLPVSILTGKLAADAVRKSLKGNAQ